MWPRELLPDERHILDVLLSQDFDGADELRAQAKVVTTSGSSCTCGCPSLRLEVDRSAPRSKWIGMVVDGVGVDAAGNLVGVQLFVNDDGYLDDLDVWAFGGDIRGGRTEGSHGKPTIESFELSRWEMSPDGRRGLLLNQPRVEFPA